MRRFRVSIIIGLFYLAMQFSSVYHLHEMMKTAREQGLSIEQLIVYQETMMQIILYSLGVSGAMFSLLILTHIIQILRMKPEEIKDKAVL